MHTELISIGSELLAGKINKDNAYIGERFQDFGLPLSLEITVPDDRDIFKKAFRDSLSRSDIVVTTGGLGPTFDDLTREVVAEVLGRKLSFKPELLKEIKRKFTRRNLRMPPNNREQAYLIDGAIPIPNSIGTAPGQIVELKGKKGKQGKKSIIMLPGPPNELIPMTEKSILPYLKSRSRRVLIKKHIFHIAGITESGIYEKVKDIISRKEREGKQEISFGILPHKGIVDIVLVGKGNNESHLNRLLDKKKKELYSAIGEFIYGEGNTRLEEVVGRMMSRKNYTIAVAESCTGGLVSNLITNVPGSSEYFLQGVVTYSNQSKMDMLKVRKATLKRYGAVSRDVAEEMAEGIRRLADSNIGLATTGIAGPAGGTSTKPVGLVYIAISKAKGVICKEYRFNGSREDIKEKIAVYALELLRRNIKNLVK